MRQWDPARHAIAPAPRLCIAAAAPRLALLLWVAWSAAACQHQAGAELRAFAHIGLAFSHPEAMEAPVPVTRAPLLGRIRGAGDVEIATAGRAVWTRAPAMPGRGHAPEAVLLPYHVELRAADGSAWLEVYIDRQPPQPRVALALARSARHGASLALAEAGTELISGQPWWRTRFSYVQERDREPVAGIEHATVAAGRLYRVTVHGAPRVAAALAAQVAPTLRVTPDRGDHAPGQEAADRSPAPPGDVDRAAEAVVAVIAADWVAAAPGQSATLRPAAMGSGVTLAPDGRVLTSFHTLHDESRDALHDLFLIGRQHRDTPGLVFMCAGRPAHGGLHRELDLAMIQCTWDMSGRPMTPARWPALSTAPRGEISTGQPLWLLGHAEVDDGARSARPGRIAGWTGAGGSPGRTFMTTDARVGPGLSGGAAVDARGGLVGVVVGFRDRFRVGATGVRRIGRVGLLRPASQVQAVISGDSGP